MRVSIINNKKIKNILLPNVYAGSYWISDTDANGISRNLILIEPEGKKWKLISNKEVYIVNNNNYSFPYVYLEEGKFYTIKNQKENKTLLLFCSNDLNEYLYYNVTGLIDNGIVIGNNKDNFVYSKNILNTFLIKRDNNQLVIYDYDIPTGIYVNDIRVNHQKVINYGDTIFSQGIKLVIVAAQDNINQVIYLGVQKRDDIIVKAPSVNKLLPAKGEYTEADEEVEFALYDEKDYFHKKPRFDSEIKPLDLQIDAPPNKQDDQNSPFILTIGPMMTMSVTSLVSGFTAVNGLMNGTTTMDRALPSLIICGAMFASIFLWPLFINFYEKHAKKKNEIKRQQKYTEYIENKKIQIANAIKDQSFQLKNKYPDINEVVNVIMNKQVTLWQRRIQDSDFLEVSLGIGSCPMKIDIKYPEEHFSMTEDNLKELVNKLSNEPKLLLNVPIVFSFAKSYISGLVGEEQLTSEYMRQLIVQLLAYHSYGDLKIIIFTNEENAYQWKFLKDTPHNFTDDKALRFFATNNEEYKEICYYLEQIYNLRKENLNHSSEDIKYDKSFLIITDDLKKIRNFEIINLILNSDKYLGFSLFVIDNKITNLPNQINNFIELYGERAQLCNNLNIKNNIQYNVSFNTQINYDEIAKTLANIPIEFNNDEDGQLPDILGFLEMYDVGKIEQLNVPSRWNNSNPMLNLAVPVGLGKNGEKISIDLHEKYHGPHGLIAGMTGSGKSEFIITYILSMALNYHPYEVQFILIDYKGGGLAGAFQNNNTGIKLPHLVGTITNLDTNEIKRSLASIESELKRRQALFNIAREKSGESTIDIYKYQKMYREGIIEEPVSHLFIICDEFAELKTQQPDFMEQLISTARIGRSLGVHLILATQKPSGVVDPQIWSNTRFRVCLKVQDKSDSNDVIKCPDAAYLKQTGRFYFQVGYNEVFVLGQSAWAGVNYKPKEKVNKIIDTSINFINNIGYPIKTKETREQKNTNEVNLGEELSNIVKYLDGIAKSQNIKCKPLWLDKLPTLIKVEELAIKYCYKKQNHIINPIIGEYDIPNEQKQNLLTIPLTIEGNVAIYGVSGSGKENFVTTLIYSSMLYYNASEICYYILDFGAETLKMFKNCPIVGDILSSNDEEKIENLFKMISKTIDERKKLFADFGGDYLNYCNSSGNSVPSIVVIINNYDAFQELYNNLEDELVIFTRECTKYGIYFVFTINSPNGLRFKLRQNFGLIYTLQQNSNDDYSTIFGNIHKNYPANIYGRGLVKFEDVYEFQTALVCERDDIVKAVKEKCAEVAKDAKLFAKPIAILPEIISYNEIAHAVGKTDELVIGIDKNDLEITTYDFNKNYINIITCNDLSIVENFLNPLINQMIYLQKKLLYVINMEEINLNEAMKKYYKYFNSEINTVFDSLYNFVLSNVEKYQKSGFNKEILKTIKPITILILGIDAFKNSLSNENQLKIEEFFNQAKALGIINFIIVDSIDKIKKLEIDSWYRNNVNNSNGIWLGSGIDDQFSLKINKRIPEMKEEVPDNFGFVIKNGKVKYIKIVESFNLKTTDNKK